MAYVILGTVLIFAGWLFIQWLSEAKLKDILKAGKWIIITLLVFVIGFLLLAGKLGLALSALPLLFIWFGKLQTLFGIGQLARKIFGARAADAGPSGQRRTSGAMSREEALEILGLEEGALPAEIKAAYHRLISQVHPDKGGSDYLAAQINQAREVLLDD